MNITNSNVNFQAYFHYTPAKTIEKLKTQEYPKTENEANEYLLLVDEVNQAINPNLWDKIYSLNLEQKRDLSKILSLTYKTYNPENMYPTTILINPKANLFKETEDIFKAGDILNEDEIEWLRNKTKGAFKLEEIEKNISLNHKNSDELEENLKFIKELMQKENFYIFRAMSPRTIVKIIQNRLLTKDDFNEALDKIKEDRVYQNAFSNIQKRPREIDYEIKEALHEYLLGESYTKIAEFDEDNFQHYFEPCSPYNY